MTNYAFVSCDLIAHSAEPSLAVQAERVTSINRIVAEILQLDSAGEIIWASGGDGGHVAFPIDSDLTVAVRLIVALRNWSIQAKANLRIIAAVGPAQSLEGADGRIQLVGHGINLAGRLLPFGAQSRVVVTREFARAAEKVETAPFRVHNSRIIEPRNFAWQEVHLLSVHNQFESTWEDIPSDRMLLDDALNAGSGLEVIYRARRLLEMSPTETAALEALRVLGLKRFRIGADDCFLNDLALDEQFGPDFLRAGSLIERRSGETICEYGDSGDTMFLVLRGRIAVFLRDSNTGTASLAEQPVSIMQPGELTGELAFALRRNRTATLRCVDDSTLLGFSYTELIKVVGDSAVRKHFIETLDRKILRRILENVWNTAPCFKTLEPDQKASSAWLRLLPNSEVVATPWSRRTCRSDEYMTERRGLCILVSGAVRCGIEVLESSSYPVLFAGFGPLSEYVSAEYELLEDVKILAIREEGLFSLGRFTYERIRQSAWEILKKRPVAPRTSERCRRPNKHHVFLSYCHDDFEEVSKLRQSLLAAGESVWWDKEILPGADWKLAIRTAMKGSYAVVLCVSDALNERQTSGLFPEALDAIGMYREFAPDGRFIIPVRLSDCEVPAIEIDSVRTLDRLQYIDLFPDSKWSEGFQALAAALKQMRSSKAGI